MEKLPAQRLFEFGDLHAQGWLNDAELTGGAGDISLLREAEEILHLLEIHAAPRFAPPLASS
jgi:hypothetical protein